MNENDYNPIPHLANMTCKNLQVMVDLSEDDIFGKMSEINSRIKSVADDGMNPYDIPKHDFTTHYAMLAEAKCDIWGFFVDNATSEDNTHTELLYSTRHLGGGYSKDVSNMQYSTQLPNVRGIIGFSVLYSAFVASLNTVFDLLPKNTATPLDVDFHFDVSCGRALPKEFREQVVATLQAYCGGVITWKNPEGEVEEARPHSFPDKKADVDFYHINNAHITLGYVERLQPIDDMLGNYDKETGVYSDGVAKECLLGSNGGKDATLSKMLLETMGCEVKTTDIHRDLIKLTDNCVFLIEEEDVVFDYDVAEDKNDSKDAYYLIRQTPFLLLAFGPLVMEFIQQGRVLQSLMLIGAEYGTDHVSGSDLSVDHGYRGANIARAYGLPTYISPIASLTEVGIFYMILKNTDLFDNWEDLNSCWTVESNYITDVQSCEFCEKCNRYKAMIMSLTVCGDKIVEDKAKHISSSWLAPSLVWHISPTAFTYSGANWIHDEVMRVVNSLLDEDEAQARIYFNNSHLLTLDNSETLDAFQGVYRDPIESILNNNGLETRSEDISSVLNLVELQLTPVNQVFQNLMDKDFLPVEYVRSWEIAFKISELLTEALPSVPELYYDDVFTEILYLKFPTTISPRFLADFRIFRTSEHGISVVNKGCVLLQDKFADLIKVEGVGDLLIDIEVVTDTLFTNAKRVMQEEFLEVKTYMREPHREFYRLFLNINKENDGLTEYVDSLYADDNQS